MFITPNAYQYITTKNLAKRQLLWKSSGPLLNIGKNISSDQFSSTIINGASDQWASVATLFLSAAASLKTDIIT